MFKKVLALIPALIVAMGLCFANVVPTATVHASEAATPTIEVTSASTIPGETATVEVVVSNNPGIMGMQLGLYYDQEALEIVGASNTQLFDIATISKNPTTYPYVLMFEAKDLETNMTANGAVAKVTFRVKDTTESGYYDVSIRYDEECIFNTEYENIAFKTIDGGIKVTTEGVKIDPDNPSPEKKEAIKQDKIKNELAAAEKNDVGSDAPASDTTGADDDTSEMVNKVWIPILVVIVVVVAVVIIAFVMKSKKAKNKNV